MQGRAINKNQFTMRAVFAGQRINMNEFKNQKPVARNPIMYQVTEDGFVVVFKYGVVVFVNVTMDAQQTWLQQAQGAIKSHVNSSEMEYLDIVTEQRQEGFSDGVLCLNSSEINKLQLIAFVLAKSVVLSYYEQNTAQLFDRIEPLANDLQARGRAYRHDKELLRHIGDVLSIQSTMVGRAEMSEKPDLLWDYPQMERLFQTLEAEYEIRERHSALEKKYDLISRTVTTLLDWLQYKRTLRVEWYIVILIVVDIVISLSEKLF